MYVITRLSTLGFYKDNIIKSLIQYWFTTNKNIEYIGMVIKVQ